nr:hypothetical protein [Allomuricauda sp.]
MKKLTASPILSGALERNNGNRKITTKNIFKTISNMNGLNTWVFPLVNLKLIIEYTTNTEMA